MPSNVYRRRKGEIKAIKPISFKKSPDRVLALGEKVAKAVGHDSPTLYIGMFGKMPVGRVGKPRVRWAPSAPLFGAVE